MSDNLDLSPRQDDAAPSPGKRSNRNKIIGAIFVVVLGFVVFQGLKNARVFFLNVDEAVAQRVDLGERTFRMQGVVVSEEGNADDGAFLFTVAFNDATAKIQHIGPEPSDLFDLGEPVVVEGRWNGDVFQSDQILVKHDESYVEDNPTRVDYELDPS